MTGKGSVLEMVGGVKGSLSNFLVILVLSALEI